MQKRSISYSTMEFDREVWAFGHLLPETLNLTTKPPKSKLNSCKNRQEFRGFGSTFFDLVSTFTLLIQNV
uniref:Uncharacterized protein n=1 Tax=Aegilops tauschii subsp. strangulata TaxID=200361 RepID=A0A453LEM7_AEGTS